MCANTPPHASETMPGEGVPQQIEKTPQLRGRIPNRDATAHHIPFNRFYRQADVSLRLLVLHQRQRMDDLVLFQIPVDFGHGLAPEVAAESAERLLQRTKGAFDLDPGRIQFDDLDGVQG